MEKIYPSIIMSQKYFCTECGTQLEDGMLFCINCGTKINVAPTENNDIRVLNNTAQWIIPQNVIARRVSSQDLENLPSLKGLTIQQGVAAYIYIDGK